MKTKKNKTTEESFLLNFHHVEYSADGHCVTYYDKDGNEIGQVIQDFYISVEKEIESKPSLWQRIKNFINYWK